MQLGGRVLVALVISAVSFTASVAAYFLNQPRLGEWVTAPALMLSGWAFAGHLVTLDDDWPDGWSNPERSWRIWFQSIGELLVKLVVFLAAIQLLLLHGGK